MIELNDEKEWEKGTEREKEGEERENRWRKFIQQEQEQQHFSDQILLIDKSSKETCFSHLSLRSFLFFFFHFYLWNWSLIIEQIFSFGFDHRLINTHIINICWTTSSSSVFLLLLLLFSRFAREKPVRGERERETAKRERAREAIFSLSLSLSVPLCVSCKWSNETLLENFL